MADLTKPLIKAIARIRKRGGCVMVHHSQHSGLSHWYCTPDGRPVAPSTVRKLRSLGELIPSGDGLFPAMDQTLHLKEITCPTS